MSKPDDYRANAKEYQRMAAISYKPNEKTLATDGAAMARHDS